MFPLREAKSPVLVTRSFSFDSGERQQPYDSVSNISAKLDTLKLFMPYSSLPPILDTHPGL